MNEGTILNSADIEDLQRFARSLEHALSEVGQNERLEDTFKLRRKFRGVVGELITLLKIYEQCGPSCRYIWYGDGKPAVDLTIESAEGRVNVQVKSKRSGGDWQGNARDWMEFEERNDYCQYVKCKVPLSDPDTVFVYVELGTRQEPDKFYVLTKAQVQDLVYIGYKRFIESHDHKRPRNPRSYHFALGTKELEQYRDNWNMIIGQLNLDRHKSLTSSAY